MIGIQVENINEEVTVMLTLAKGEKMDALSAISSSSSYGSDDTETTSKTTNTSKKTEIIKGGQEPGACTTSIELLLLESGLLSNKIMSLTDSNEDSSLFSDEETEDDLLKQIFGGGSSSSKFIPSLNSNNNNNEHDDGVDDDTHGNGMNSIDDFDIGMNNNSFDIAERLKRLALPPRNNNKCQQVLEWCRVYTPKNIVPDDKVYIGRCQIFDSKESIRLFKFLFLTMSSVLFMHFFIRLVGWDHDSSYTIIRFLREDMNDVAMDSISFFVIGRLYKRKGVDRLIPFIVPMLMSCLLISWSRIEIWYIKNPITWYNIQHIWPWQVNLYTAVCLCLLLLLPGLHVIYSIIDGTLIYRSIEILLFILMLIISSKHRWYLFWFAGVLCNREEWWSQLTMALLWGIYINGLSAYGRDSLYSGEL